jgi:hypothetical protein
MNGSDDDRQIEPEELLAAEELDSGDFALLNSVRAYYDERDPAPDGLVDRIQFQLTLDALHTEVATLTQLDLATAGTRSATTEAVRTITFTSDSVTTMVTLTPLGDGSVRVDGWAAPGAGILVELLLPDGPHNTYADDDGRFVFEGVPSGLAKFALHVPHGTELFTVLSPAIEL